MSRKSLVVVRRTQKTLFESRAFFYVIALSVFLLCIAGGFATVQLENIVAPHLISSIKAILFSIASTFLVVMIVDGFLLKRSLIFLKEYIGDSFSERLEGSSLALHGIAAVHNGMPNDLIERHILESRNLFFLQTFIADIVHLEVSLKKFFENGGTAQVLVLDPQSEIVEIRSREIVGLSPNAFRANIVHNIAIFKKHGGKAAEIRLHSCTPSVSIYGNEQKMFVGNYLQDKHAVQGPILEVNHGHYFNEMIDHYEKVWHKSKLLDKNIYVEQGDYEGKPIPH